jgi:hypothetical protein
LDGIIPVGALSSNFNSICAPPQVFGLNPITGAVVSGPVSLSGPVDKTSDGFTVLPNGNFLINTADESCTYNQFNPTTGAVIPATTITVSASACTGVTNNGVHLFFQTNFNSFTETDFTGFVIAAKTVTSPVSCAPGFVDCVFDISLVTLGCSGVPGRPSCYGKCVSSLAQQYGGFDKAASALGYSSVAALQSAIDGFCAAP